MKPAAQIAKLAAMLKQTGLVSHLLATACEAEAFPEPCLLPPNLPCSLMQIPGSSMPAICATSPQTGPSATDCELASLQPHSLVDPFARGGTPTPANTQRGVSALARSG